MAKTHTGVTLTAAQRKQLIAIMAEKPQAKVAEELQVSLHTLKAAAYGLHIQRGTALLIGQWLEKNGGQAK